MLSRAPFVSVTLFFAAGIFAGDVLRAAADVTAALLWGALLLVGIGCLLFYFRGPRTGFAVSWAAWMLVLGACCKMSLEATRDGQLADLNALKYSSYVAEVATHPEKRGNSVRVEVRVERLRCDSQWIVHPVRALVYLPGSLPIIPKPGDRLVINGRLQQPEPPKNPGQFDYRRYLRNKGILFTAFVRNGSYRLISKHSETNPFYWPEAVSQWADGRFRDQIGDSAAYGLVKAMLLGRRDDLHEQQVGDYVISGAVHILSVSGMHVAIIFLAAGTAFGWLRRWRSGNWIYLFLMAVLLGFYALVTGLLPSVQRAALMCMVLVMAETAGRKHNSMNTLAFSALMILLPDPCGLYDVGFQLSYLAMSGIFLLYEAIYGILRPSNRIFKFIWQVTALAFAAQIATFPLSLFYFHQFPTYFWLVNPLIVVFTNILLPAALLLLVASVPGIAWLSWLTGRVVSVSAWLTDWSASIPRKLPGHLIENLHLTALEVWILYGFIFLVWYALHSRSAYVLKLSVAVAALFVTVSFTSSLNTYLRAEQIVFQVPKHRVIGFKTGSVLYLVSDKAFAGDSQAFDFNLKNYVADREIERIVRVTAR
ncbi:ComEC/Rec2 family competence protein [Dyadobacter sp. 676]|uniref:ComEC/Rec2 family competence protein n=1 Tax=Dyadobacter sp. 676 TaxID=3088362 RepID=A0AAU8FLE4_9BACT